MHLITCSLNINSLECFKHFCVCIMYLKNTKLESSLWTTKQTLYSPFWGLSINGSVFNFFKGCSVWLWLPIISFGRISLVNTKLDAILGGFSPAIYKSNTYISWNVQKKIRLLKLLSYSIIQIRSMENITNKIAHGCML